MNQKRGRRWSATNAFLRPAMHRANLTVMTGAAGFEVGYRGEDVSRRANFSIGRRSFAVEARSETILAAGAIGSPQLLQLSGIGT